MIEKNYIKMCVDGSLARIPVSTIESSHDLFSSFQGPVESIQIEHGVIMRHDSLSFYKTTSLEFPLNAGATAIRAALVPHMLSEVYGDVFFTAPQAHGDAKPGGLADSQLSKIYVYADLVRRQRDALILRGETV
jgi:hypothetical protein